MTTYRQPGTVVTEHRFDVPLRHADPAGETIEVFARELVADESGGGERPYLVFLQGGPGMYGPRPLGADDWRARALKDYRVLLLDQRGTGRSTPANRRTLATRGDARAQAEYLTHFRADAIVADCELIRRQLLGDQPWDVLGQSFGGFCTITYLSFAPAGVGRALLTGGLPGVDSTADDVYRLTYPTVIERARRHYDRYPGDADVIAALARRLLDAPVTLPAGGTLTVEALQSLGQLLGMKPGSHRLHYLLEKAGSPTARELPDEFLAAVEQELSFVGGPLYAVLHEACYAQGGPTAWAAQRVRAEFGGLDAAAALERGEPVLFTGEMIFPWMFDTDPVLRPLREVADLLAAKDDWPALYDAAQLARTEATVRAAVYYDDMYVPRELSLRTAAGIRGAQCYITNEFEHDGLHGDTVLDHLLTMRSD